MCFHLIYVYKILFSMVETDASNFFRVRNTSTVTRGHSLKLFVPQSRLDVRKYFFCHRVVHCWNSLPAQPDDFLSLNKFKRLLERVDLSGLYRVLTDRFHLNEHLCLSAPCQ